MLFFILCMRNHYCFWYCNTDLLTATNFFLQNAWFFANLFYLFFITFLSAVNCAMLVYQSMTLQSDNWTLLSNNTSNASVNLLLIMLSCNHNSTLCSPFHNCFMFQNSLNHIKPLPCVSKFVFYCNFLFSLFRLTD